MYGPPEGEATGWQQQGGRDRLLRMFDDAEPRCVLLSDLTSFLFSTLSPIGYIHHKASYSSLSICCVCTDHNHLHLPRLRKLAEWARDPHIITVNRENLLQEWYHADGPLVLVGQAAQPIAVRHYRSFCCIRQA